MMKNLFHNGDDIMRVNNTVEVDQQLVEQMRRDYYFARRNGCDKTWGEYVSFCYHTEANYERHYGRTPMTWAEFKTRYGIDASMVLNRTDRCRSRIVYA